MRPLALSLNDIQGDVLEGLPKNVENYLFFKITNPVSYKSSAGQYLTRKVTTAEEVHQQELALERKKKLGQRNGQPFHGLNLGFTKEGVTQLLGTSRPKMDPSFERGADHSDTAAALNDPPRSRWLPKFVADRIDGVFLITGPEQRS